MDQNVKVEVKDWFSVIVLIDGTEYKSGKFRSDLKQTPFEITHKPLGWYVKLGYEGEQFNGKYTLAINGLRYEDMDEAPPRERAEIARTSISFKMDGPIKSAKFAILRKGESIGVSIQFNSLTKFAKL